MESCALMQEMMSRMLDDDLNADERAALAKHLESCDACKAMYEAFAAVSDALGGELAEPPESLCEKVMSEIRREEIRKKNRRPWRAVLSVAAVLALVLGLRFGPGLRGAPMSASVQNFAVGTGESAVPEDRAPLEENASAKRTAPEAAPFAANGAEQPAPAGGAAGIQADPALTMPAAESAAASGAASVIELPDLRLSELLEKLNGEATELRLDALAEPESVTVLCADSALALFEHEGDWYYYDPAGLMPRRSRLTPDDLRALAED